MTRKEHMDWAKARAIAEVGRGDPVMAFTSMASDLGKHPETQSHPALQLGMMLMMSRRLDNPVEMQRFIEGFN